MMEAIYDGMICKIDYDGFNPLTDCHELYITTPFEFSEWDCNVLADQVSQMFIDEVLTPALADVHKNLGLPEGLSLHSFCSINVIIGMDQNVQAN